MITKKLALQATVNYLIPDESLEKALIDNDLVGTETYSKADAKSIDLCGAGLILFVLTSANVSEGGYSISISDREGLLKTRSLLLAKWGVPDNTAPKITDVSNLW